MSEKSEEITSWPNTEFLKELGYPGLSIIERHATGELGDWAICVEASYLHLYAGDAGILPMDSNAVVSNASGFLIDLRDRLFPSEPEEELSVSDATMYVSLPRSHKEKEAQPEIGWFLISSVF